MYHSQNFYAARAAAISEVREMMRLEAQASAAPQPHRLGETCAPRYFEDLMRCGSSELVTLGHPFGDRRGEVVRVKYLYPLALPGWWLGRFADETSGKTYFIKVASYSRRDDLYNLAISVEAAL